MIINIDILFFLNLHIIKDNYKFLSWYENLNAYELEHLIL